MSIHKIRSLTSGDLLHVLNTEDRSTYDLRDRQDLRHADFRNLDLTGINLNNAAVSNSDFSGSILIRASFRDAEARTCTFSNADLTSADLYHADVRWSLFTDAYVVSSSFIEAQINNAYFSTATLRYTDFAEARGIYEAQWPSGSTWTYSTYGVAYCTGCADVCSTQDGHDTVDHGFRCDSCGYEYCDDCDDYYSNYYDHRSSEHENDDCEEDDYCSCGCQSNGTIRNYSFKPRWVSHGLSQVKFGFELELSGSGHHAGLVKVADPTETVLFCKEDSSIPGGGFEIVSHPMDLDWFNGNFDHSLIPNLRAAGMRTSDGAGLHVHVSRKAFAGNFHTLSWLNLIYRNSEAMTKLARRNSDQWARFHKPAKGELPAKAKANGDLYRWDRYQFVNCQNNGTFEIRGFRSTLNRVKLRAALEFVDASVEYTRQVKTRDVLKGGGLTWTHFYNWVITRPDRYPHLQQQMEELTADYIATL